MYTPQEVQDKKFPKAVFGGYDMGEVDDFLDAVSSDYAALYKENAVLKNKMKVLAEKVEEYRSVDAAMRQALIVAQKMANDMTEDAKVQSDQIRSKAQQDYESAIAALRDNIANEERRLNRIKNETKEFVDSNIRICEMQIQKFNTLLSEPVKASLNTPEEIADDIEKVITMAVERATAEDVCDGDLEEKSAKEKSAEEESTKEKSTEEKSVGQSLQTRTSELAVFAGPVQYDVSDSEEFGESCDYNLEGGSVSAVSASDGSSESKQKVQEVNVGGVNIRVFEMDLGGDKASRSGRS